MQNFLMLTVRRWKEIIAITVLATALSTAFGYLYNKTSYNNTIFITVGAGQRGMQTTAGPYESVEAADAFSETVQGWFKNQSLLDQIKVLAGYEPDFNVRKQEKQNLLVTFRTPDENMGKTVARATEQTIRAEVANYDGTTGSDFSLSAFELTAKAGTVNLLVFAALGTVLGLLLSYALCAAYEKFLAELNKFRHGKT